jgi:hypothetical protein
MSATLATAATSVNTTDLPKTPRLDKPRLFATAFRSLLPMRVFLKWVSVKVWAG